MKNNQATPIGAAWLFSWSDRLFELKCAQHLLHIGIVDEL